ncbi:hypothetical protein [Lacibacter sp.]|uniref:hypothetical protein n=1 Tax=Lacibacter sp. TaxID=1915409 RepID=UPI002B4ADF5F|nr:hypothetical protein [Lacibacter sp.]HLP35617.1 hypothetical protein [Lacibacter sp.]
MKPINYLLTAGILLFITACERQNNPNDSENGSTPVFLLIDEESIDNGNEPNNFSANDVNDQLASVGLRQQLRYFQDNVGKTIDLYTGDVGDEGWHALKTIPSGWISTGPTTNGTRNFLQAGPKLGGGEDDKEILLDKIPDVTPLRATGLSMLIGKTILAVVYDGDISINYSPLNGNLQGANLGIVAFDVLSVTKRTDGSTSSLPKVTVRIRNAAQTSSGILQLFSNAPVPQSSSEPFDVNPPAAAPAAILVAAQ